MMSLVGVHALRNTISCETWTQFNKPFPTKRFTAGFIAALISNFLNSKSSFVATTFYLFFYTFMIKITA